MERIVEVKKSKVKKKKTLKRARKLKLHPKVKNAGQTAFRFFRHFTEESPKMLWRIASFDSSASEIRNSIILPLAEMITKLKTESLTPEEREHNNFKLILFWPELVLKLQGFFRKAAITIGYTALTKTPRFYQKNKSGELDKIKQELQNLILLRFWKNLKKAPVNESKGFIKRLKSAIEMASDFADQPQLQGIVKSVISDLGFDELQKAIAFYTSPNAKAYKKK